MRLPSNPLPRILQPLQPREQATVPGSAAEVGSPDAPLAPAPGGPLETVVRAVKDAFVGERFSPAKQAPPPAKLPRTPIETLYTDPFTHDTIGDRFAQVVDAAKTSIEGAFFEIADERITGALARAAERGVDVRLVTDDNYFRDTETLGELEARVPVLDAANEWLKAARRLKPNSAGLEGKAQELLAQFPAISEALANVPGPALVDRDFEPARIFLESLRPGGQDPDRTAVDALYRGIAGELGAERVRLIFRPAYEVMLQAGVQIRDDDSALLSHNKYMVLDGQRTWMGSYNLQGLKSETGETAGLYSAADNVVVMNSPEIAAQFQADFRQMFEEGRFHTAKTGVGGTKVKVSGVNVTPYFAPQDPINANMTADLGALLWKIREAKEAGRNVQMPVIRLAGFAMNYAGSEALVDTLALLHREGADVKVLTDVLNGTSKTSTARVLAEKGVPTAVTDNGVMMHHKFLSIEGGTGRNILWTGSANFTRPAYQENDESVVRIESTAMVRAYQAIFDSLGDNLKERQPFDFSNQRVLAGPRFEAARFDGELFEGEFDGVEGAPAVDAEAWLEIDPSSIRTMADAQRYALQRWGA